MLFDFGFHYFLSSQQSGLHSLREALDPYPLLLQKVSAREEQP